MKARDLSLRGLLSLLAVGFVLAVTAAQLLVSFGWAFPVSPLSLTLTLALLGPLVFAATLPIRRYQKRLERYFAGKAARPERVNPFYAFRVLLLSRASALAGSGFLGWHIGLLAALALLGVAGSSLLPGLIWGLLASALLSGLSVWAEFNCRIPGDQPPPGEAPA